MCWHARLSRLKSASDVATRDHVVAHPDRASMPATIIGQATVMSRRLRTFGALGLWRRSQKTCGRLIDGGWLRVTHSRQQVPGFLKAQDRGFDIGVRIMKLSHQPGLRGCRHEPQERAREVIHSDRQHVAMSQQGFVEGPSARGERPTMLQDFLHIFLLPAIVLDWLLNRSGTSRLHPGGADKDTWATGGLARRATASDDSGGR